MFYWYFQSAETTRGDCSMYSSIEIAIDWSIAVFVCCHSHLSAATGADYFIIAISTDVCSVRDIFLNYISAAMSPQYNTVQWKHLYRV